MKILTTLLLCIGCSGNILKIPFRSVIEYNGETGSYYIEARETFYSGLCNERRIILRHKNNPHANEEVSFVEAIDRECDDTIESFRFRDYRDKLVDRKILEDDILFMFYSIKYNGIRR